MEQLPIKKLRRLAGLEEDDDLDNAQYEREDHIKKLIASAFKMIDLEVNYSSSAIIYDDPTREATVKLEDSDCMLSKLMQLMHTGLASDYKITSYSDVLTIEFIVSAELDSGKFNP
jgi:hypothetical protein